MREELVAKLRPDRFTAMSGKTAAIFGYILDERFSEPAISELVVTSDGSVRAQGEGEVGANEMLGTEVDLNRNLLDLIAAAGLTDEEIHEFGRLQRKHLRRSRAAFSEGSNRARRRLACGLLSAGLPDLCVGCTQAQRESHVIGALYRCPGPRSARPLRRDSLTDGVGGHRNPERVSRPA